MSGAEAGVSATWLASAYASRRFQPSRHRLRADDDADLKRLDLQVYTDNIRGSRFTGGEDSRWRAHAAADAFSWRKCVGLFAMARLQPGRITGNAGTEHRHGPYARALPASGLCARRCR
jgi:hypothetical protein